MSCPEVPPATDLTGVVIFTKDTFPLESMCVRMPDFVFILAGSCCIGNRVNMAFPHSQKTVIVLDRGPHSLRSSQETVEYDVFTKVSRNNFPTLYSCENPELFW